MLRMSTNHRSVSEKRRKEMAEGQTLQIVRTEEIR